MRIKVYPGVPSGEVRPPCSKSMAHRAFFCAAMAKGESLIEGLDMSDDLEATADFCRGLGAEITFEGSAAKVRPFEDKGTVRANCRQSGSTLRFALPVLLAFGRRGELEGRGRLLQRPMESYRALCAENGWVYEQTGDRITVEGCMKPGRYRLGQVVSSQFVSGMMMALGSLRGQSVIEYGHSPSAPYIEMTAAVMAHFGCDVRLEKGAAYLGGGYKGQSYQIEGDWSHGAFWAAFGSALGSVRPLGLSEDSPQGDRHMLSLLASGEGLLDCTDYPDLAPAAAAYGCFCGGMKLTNVGRLADKESDRAAGIVELINAAGGYAERRENEIIIEGVRPKGGVTVAVSDHRMAMMAAFLACGAEDGVIIDGAECVGKSYPDFWNHLGLLGIKTEVLDEKA